MTRYIAFEAVGRFHAIDDSSGYWTTYTYENGTDAGLWIKEDGSDNGGWDYDEDSENSGIWWNANNTAGG